MIHTVNHNVTGDNGTQRNIIIEPVLHQSTNHELNATGLYKLYKGGADGEATLFEIQEIAPEIGESKPLLDDNKNPDYLGQIRFEGDVTSKWHYSEGTLSNNEQQQVVEFIQNTN
ncbi:hypothetical protein J3L18_03905 [Mucilaginibacter gossypii]|uniref:hypothetical protein n=1 Tax=Mucilaginibacter gossypii TaxID=551996 RepID=UPI000DCD0275|nr:MULTISPECIES: hypothetical protein [Mucilaginibacter]QTE38227.1 hypothetical protein J3L18_03905 [Mucilaginibacter gossypii]RAV60300.1 hypothetical protein DIU36_01400 [Mucilaginibacter rubeus]